VRKVGYNAWFEFLTIEDAAQANAARFIFELTKITPVEELREMPTPR